MEESYLHGAFIGNVILKLCDMLKARNWGCCYHMGNHPNWVGESGNCRSPAPGRPLF
jgi:hypothetical protein